MHLQVMKQPTDKKPPKKAKTIDFLEFEEEFNREAAKVLEKSDSGLTDPTSTRQQCRIKTNPDCNCDAL